MTVQRLDRDELGGLPEFAPEDTARLRPANRLKSTARQLLPAARADYSRAFEGHALDLAARVSALCREREASRPLAGRLSALPAGERRAAIRSRDGFRSWSLCELLIDDCHELLYAETAGAEETSDLALMVAEELDESYYGSQLVSDLRARAWAAVGEVRRTTSDLRGADEAFALAEAFLAVGTGDALEAARLGELQASLRRDQRRTAEAHRLLDKVIAVYRQHRDLHLLGRAFVHKGRIHGVANDFAAAVLWLRKGLGLLDPRRERGLALSAKHSMMLYLAEGGRQQEAWLLLKASLPEFRELGGELLTLRLRWLEGKIRLALGHREEAEALLIEARRGFVAQEIGFDAALVSLDLARLYAGLGHAAEMRRLAAETLPIFRSRDLHREAIAALIVFQQAVQMADVSSHLLQEIDAYLRRARSDDQLRFEYSL
ncbi:MAG TPA: hypothetical protein VOA87_00960 [Thermoanaerobaculia bacterium]|nr:hypothetical protein [Thermoanaerobaculia bacterium]